MSHEDPRSTGPFPHVFDFDDPWDEPMPSWLADTASAPRDSVAGDAPTEPAMPLPGGAGGVGDTGIPLVFDDLAPPRGPARATGVLAPPGPTPTFEPVAPPDPGAYRGGYTDRRRYLPLLALGALAVFALAGVLVRAVSGSDDPTPASTTSSEESGRRVDPTRASSGADGTVTSDAAVLGAGGASDDLSGLGGAPSGGGGESGGGGGDGAGPAGSGGGRSTPAGGGPGSPGGASTPDAAGPGGAANPSGSGSGANGTRSVSNSQVSTNGAPASSHSVATGGGSSGPAPGSGSSGGGGSSSSPPTGSSGGGTPSGSSSSGVNHSSSGVSSSNSSSTPGT